MDDFEQQRYVFTYQYKELERELLKAIKIIPITKYNLNANSMYFANLCLNSAVLFENIGIQIMRLYGIPTNDKNFGKCYEEFFNTKKEFNVLKNYQPQKVCLELSNFEIELLPYDPLFSEQLILYPLAYKDKKGPEWWQLQNDLKHNQNKKEFIALATLQNALNAVSSTYSSLLLLYSLKPNRLFLLKRSGQYNQGTDIVVGCEVEKLSYIDRKDLEPGQFGQEQFCYFEYPVKSKLFHRPMWKQ